MPFLGESRLSGPMSNVERMLRQAVIIDKTSEPNVFKFSTLFPVGSERSFSARTTQFGVQVEVNHKTTTHEKRFTLELSNDYPEVEITVNSAQALRLRYNEARILETVESSLFIPDKQPKEGYGKLGPPMSDGHFFTLQIAPQKHTFQVIKQHPSGDIFLTQKRIHREVAGELPRQQAHGFLYTPPDKDANFDVFYHRTHSECIFEIVKFAEGANDVVKRISIPLTIPKLSIEEIKADPTVLAHIFTEAFLVSYLY